jgi:hypothetical protein
MTRTAFVRLFIAQTVVLVLVGWAAVYLGRDEFRLATEREDDALPSASLVTEGPPGELPALHLTTQARERAGILVQAPAAGSAGGMRGLVATVLDVQPLAQWRGRITSAAHELSGARASAEASRAEAERMQAMFEDDRNASQRARDAALALSRVDLAKAQSQQSQLDALRRSARVEWGPVVSKWLDGAVDDPTLLRLINGQEVLLQVVVRADAAKLPKTLSIILPDGNVPATARAVSTAGSIGAESAHGGRVFLFIAAGQGLAPGMRLSAQASDDGLRQGVAGAMVPSSAVVWHAGQPWIYVREAIDDDDAAAEAAASAAAAPNARQPDVFRRRALGPAAVRGGSHWFVPGLTTDEAVVTQGAQLLLSEEQKTRIKNENDD